MSNAVATKAATGKRFGLGRRGRIIAAVVAVLVLAVVGLGAWMSYVPADLDLSTTRVTDGGLFQVSYEPSQDPIPVNQLHAWTLTVTNAEGDPVEDAVIGIDGDMPQHGHGLPTEPQVTQNLGGGRYLVEGVKFQMGGWWVMDFIVDAAGQRDQVRFNFILK